MATKLKIDFEFINVPTRFRTCQNEYRQKSLADGEMLRRSNFSELIHFYQNNAYEAPAEVYYGAPRPCCRPSVVFADRIQRSQTELGVCTQNVRVRRPNTSTVYLIIATYRISRITKCGDQVEDRLRVH